MEKNQIETPKIERNESFKNAGEYVKELKKSLNNESVTTWKEFKKIKLS